MSNTLLEKFLNGEWREFTEKEKWELLDSQAKDIGETLESYRNLERRSLEKARTKIIG